MTEHQAKEVLKFFLHNGNQKLSTEDKEAIKLAIGQANNITR